MGVKNTDGKTEAGKEKGRQTAWMRLADLGDTQLKEFGVQALTHAKRLPQSCFTRTAAYPPGGASAQEF